MNTSQGKTPVARRTNSFYKLGYARGRGYSMEEEQGQKNRGNSGLRVNGK